MKSFLRWAGGKTKIVNSLGKHLPIEFNSYWEPFLGSGALFFSNITRESFLSDINKDLINCFQKVKESPHEILNFLEIYQKNDSKQYYYFQRELYNKSGYSVEQAARFIYLNKSNFNGIFRVNKNGKYNVPYGYKKILSMPKEDDLLQASIRLSKASLICCDYRDIINLGKLRPKDFIYLDPPYPPINGVASFTNYTADKFSLHDQENVADLANKLSKMGCFVMVSNSDVEFIRDLFNGWNIKQLPVRRWLSANGQRKSVYELIIKNY